VYRNIPLENWCVYSFRELFLVVFLNNKLK
jgi:hypothetical protein